MLLIHIRTFRVRHHECDAYGRVHPAVYMRYAQEAAFDASAAAGYGLDRYQELDRLWLARESEIEVLHPLRYGDPVQVRTWVADFRRVRSARAYEFRRAGSDELVARALTDWVYLELSTGTPVAIPPDMQAAFFPEGAPPPARARGRFPAAPTPPPGVFRQGRRAEWRDIDAAGHVNNAAYLTYVEDCALQALAACGWPVSRLHAEGLAVATQSHRIEYRQPALLDDELELTTWLSDLHQTAFVRHTIITRLTDNAIISHARTIQALTRLETGRPVTIPAKLAAALAPAVSA